MRNFFLRFVGAAVLSLALAAPHAVDAMECPVVAGGDLALSHRDSAERIQFLLERLDAEHGRAHTWVAAWDIALSALTVGPLLALPLVGQKLPLGLSLEERDLAFSAFTSAATMASIALIPLPSWSPVPKPTGSSCEELAALEKIAIARALAEAADHSLWAHIRNVLINGTVATLGLGLGLGRWHSAWIGTITGSAIGEVMLLSKPDVLSDDLKRYRTGSWSTSPQALPELGFALNFGSPSPQADRPLGKGDGIGLVLSLRF